MKRLILISLLILFSCKVNHIPEIVLKPKPEHVTYIGKSKELLDIFNNYRDSLGLQLVKPEKELTSYAISHCYFMESEGKASHSNILWRKGLFLKQGYKNYDEVVAEGYTKPEFLFKAYLRSEGHANILKKPIWDWVGIGFVKDEVLDKEYNVIFLLQE